MLSSCRSCSTDLEIKLNCIKLDADWWWTYINRFYKGNGLVGPQLGAGKFGTSSLCLQASWYKGYPLHMHVHTTTAGTWPGRVHDFQYLVRTQLIYSTLVGQREVEIVKLLVGAEGLEFWTCVLEFGVSSVILLLEVLIVDWLLFPV